MGDAEGVGNVDAWHLDSTKLLYNLNQWPIWITALVEPKRISRGVGGPWSDGTLIQCTLLSLTFNVLILSPLFNETLIWLTVRLLKPIAFNTFINIDSKCTHVSFLIPWFDKCRYSVPWFNDNLIQWNISDMEHWKID